MSAMQVIDEIRRQEGACSVFNLTAADWWRRIPTITLALQAELEPT